MEKCARNGNDFSRFSSDARKDFAGQIIRTVEAKFFFCIRDVNCLRCAHSKINLICRWRQNWSGERLNFLIVHFLRGHRRGSHASALNIL
jgi:hypothetical protein